MWYIMSFTWKWWGNVEWCILWGNQEYKQHIEKVTDISYIEFLLCEKLGSNANDCDICIEVQTHLPSIWQGRRTFGWHGALVATALVNPTHRGKTQYKWWRNTFFFGNEEAMLSRFNFMDGGSYILREDTIWVMKNNVGSIYSHGSTWWCYPRSKGEICGTTKSIEERVKVIILYLFPELLLPEILRNEVG